MLKPLNRFSYLSYWLLLALLLASQVSLSAHAASHTSEDHVVCQLCHAYDTSSHALVSNTPLFVVDSGPQAQSSYEGLAPALVSTLNYQARAPPAFI